MTGPPRRPATWLTLLAVIAAAAVIVAVLDLTSGPPNGETTHDRSVDAAGIAVVQTRTASRSADATPITLEWVGDISLSTELGLPPGGFDGALGPLAPTLKHADITLGNLEGTLSVGGISKCGVGGNTATCFAFQAPPETAFGLHRLGFDLVNQANNHAQDYGPDGHAQTLAALHRAGLKSTGDPGQITYLTVRGVRIAFAGFAPYSNTANLLDIPAAQALVRRAALHAALVVVIIHAGAEGADQTHTPAGTEYFLGEDRGAAREFAHAVLRAGASVVLGSGPHVIRGVQRYRGHLIAYSLGNFVGYRTLGGGGVLDDSGILRVSLNPASGTVAAARWIPVMLQSGIPRRAAGDGDVGLVAALSRRDFPHSHFTIESGGRFVIGTRRRPGP